MLLRHGLEAAHSSQASPTLPPGSSSGSRLLAPALCPSGAHFIPDPNSNTGEPFGIVIDVHMLCRFYATDAELKRLFKSINGIIFPVSGTAAS